MNRAAVLGSPVAHSLSPVLHQAAFVSLGLDDWTYGCIEVAEDGLAGFVGALDGSWRGLSLTMPLKRVCLEVADEVSDVAARTGVGNTLTRLPDGRWRAGNTDVGGIVDALRPHWDAAWTTAAIVGAGATALSAVFALRELGVHDVTVHARDLGKADALAHRAESLGLAAHSAQLLADGTQPVLVSTVPAGVDVSAAVETRSLVFDVVYDGWPTPLARAAQAAGVPVVGGLDMLVGQAARQFEVFTGLAAPVEAMLVAGRAALEARA